MKTPTYETDPISRAALRWLHLETCYEAARICRDLTARTRARTECVPDTILMAVEQHDMRDQAARFRVLATVARWTRNTIMGDTAENTLTSLQTAVARECESQVSVALDNPGSPVQVALAKAWRWAIKEQLPGAVRQATIEAKGGIFTPQSYRDDVVAKTAEGTVVESWLFAEY